MKRQKWYIFLIVGLAIVLAGSLMACTKKEEVPYAPGFTLQTINGETVSLSDFRGKPVMLIFWKIDCAACEFQMPFMQSFSDEWSSEKIAVLTINVGDRATVVDSYVASRRTTLPVLLDPKGQVAQAYGIIGVPFTFIIDAEGILKAYKIGPFQSRQEIEAALKTVFPSLTLTPRFETGPEIGKLAPDFTLKAINGQSVTLSSFRGRTVLLNFWVSSCPACIDEMPYLQAVFNERAHEGLVILAINCGETSQTVQSTIGSLGLTFPILLDPDKRVCTDYKRGSPTTFLIDGKGTIKAIKDDAFQSPGEIESMLKSL